jgi:molecular chaperone GrpE
MDIQSENSVSDKPTDDTMSDDADIEDGGPKIGTSAEMEEALREATESLESRQKEAAAAVDASSPDKMTIELLSTELRDLKEVHEETLKEQAENMEKSLRLQAEFDNFRRRSLKEKQESFKFGNQNLVKDLLSAVDNLERALEHGTQIAEGDGRSILDGVELVHREILAAFAKHGVREIEAVGQLFDPAVHEAMGQIPSDDVPANGVLEVLQKGYVIHDRMLRPARVIVSRGPTDSEASAGNGEAGSDSA